MVPYDSDAGRQAFARKLRTTVERCSNCGFADTLLDGEWRTRTGSDPKSGHVVYHLRCPDCGQTTDVEVNLP